MDNKRTNAGFTAIELLVVVGGIGLVAGLVGFVGCSRESRDEAITRAADAARALNGDPDEPRTPDIVRKQQNDEKKRQNTEWTAENQAQHPIEYCQAQLKQVDDMARRLETEVHKLNVLRAGQDRKAKENDTTAAKMEKQLAELKAAYREAEAAGSWPMSYNGFQLPQPKAQKFIVETNARLTAAREQSVPIKNVLARIDRRLAEIQKEQVTLVRTKEKLNVTLSALQAKDVVESEKGISDALQAINDSIGSLSGWTDELSFEDISAGTPEMETASAFDEIMAQQ